MELRYVWAVYITLAVIAALLIYSLVKIRKQRRYNGGSKVVEARYLKEIPYFRRKVITYKVLKVILSLIIIISLSLSGLLMARPYRTEVKEIQNMNRDIILCMDISTTVDNLNAVLIDKLKNVVEDLNGERFGIVIFNTSPLYLVPLTSDYRQVINELDMIEEALDLRTAYYAGRAGYSSRLVELDAYISNGTLIGNEQRGSSIIGDGLAAAALDFPDVEERPDRSRIIIFTTDNDLMGDEIITLPEAGEICKEKGITVYGIGTEYMYTADRNMMKNTVENTGGKFYYGENPNTVEHIVEDIRKHVTSLDTSEFEITETDVPEIPFILLLISFASMILLMWLIKV